MADKKDQAGAPARTRMIEHGQELPPPSDSDLAAKSDPLPKKLVARLHMESGPKAPAVIKIKKSVLVLGRGDMIADVDVGDASASRRHAYIIYHDNDFWLKDMGSTNGTVLNGELVGKVALKSGDRIQIGTAVMRLEIK